MQVGLTAIVILLNDGVTPCASIVLYLGILAVSSVFTLSIVNFVRSVVSLSVLVVVESLSLLWSVVGVLHAAKMAHISAIGIRIFFHTFR